MLDTSRIRTPTKLVAVLIAAVIIVGAALILTSGHHAGAPAARMEPSVTAASSSTVSEASPSSPASSPSPPALPGLPATASPDVFAAEVTRALFGLDYRVDSRGGVVAFWQRELATVLPAGVPAGSTLADAQSAAMSTIADYLPTAATWTNLAQDNTVSRFTVTGVTEPPSWVAGVTSGKITDPGLTARTVLGIQTITYGVGSARRTTAQSQQLTVAMLCPPTTAACALEILPPRDTAGTG